MSDTDIVRAKAEAAAARERLLGAAQALQTRLKPAALAGDVWETAREKSEEIAGGAARAIGKRPLAASAAAIGIAALFARKPIVRLIGKLRGKN